MGFRVEVERRGGGEEGVRVTETVSTLVAIDSGSQVGDRSGVRAVSRLPCDLSPLERVADRLGALWRLGR